MDILGRRDTFPCISTISYPTDGVLDIIHATTMRGGLSVSMTYFSRCTDDVMSYN